MPAGRKPITKNPKNFKINKATCYSSGATCPFYQYHTKEYLVCESQLLSKEEYDPLHDCCEDNYLECPQYKYLMMQLNRK